MVSHDRDFLDRVATTTVAMEGDGQATVYAGGWSDYQFQRGTRPEPGIAAGLKPAPKAAPKPAAPRKSALSFTEKHRLEALPAEIDKLTAEIAKLAELLADPDLFTKAPAKFAKATEALAERQAKKDAAEEEWLALAEKAEA